jgi:hypothetical protein
VGRRQKAAVETSGPDVVRVDERPRIVAGRLSAAPLLGPPGFRWRRETRNPDLDLAPIARRQFSGLGIERLTGDRAHGLRVLLGVEAHEPGSTVPLRMHSGSTSAITVDLRLRTGSERRVGRDNLKRTLATPPWVHGVPGMPRWGSALRQPADTQS